MLPGIAWRGFSIKFSQSKSEPEMSFAVPMVSVVVWKSVFVNSQPVAIGKCGQPVLTRSPNRLRNLNPTPKYLLEANRLLLSCCGLDLFILASCEGSWLCHF